LLPVLASVAIIAINLRHMFLGRSFPGLITSDSVNSALLQLAAKIQELLVVASMATVMLDALRHEMLYGEGVPLGMIPGGFLFTSLQYFWSPGFWGAISAKLSRMAKLRLAALLLIGGLIATLAGPSSAILIIPRQQLVSAGGATIYLHGSEAARWPAQVKFSSSGVQPFCAYDNATHYIMCPSGGYHAILNSKNAPIFGLPAYDPINGQNISSSFMHGTQYLTVSHSSHLLPHWRYKGNWRGYACKTTMSGLGAAESMYQLELLRNWRNEAHSIPYRPGQTSQSNYKYSQDVFATTELSKAPAVIVACSSGQNISYVGNTTILFPVLSQDDCSQSGKEFNVAQFSQSPADHGRITWVQLPREFGPVSTGVIFEAPPTSSRSSRVVVGCYVEAHWIVASTSTGGSRVLVSPVSEVYTEAETISSSQPPVELSSTPGYSEFDRNVNRQSRPIDLDESWLEILASPAPPAAQTDWNQPQLNILESAVHKFGLAKGLHSPSLSETEMWNDRESPIVNRTVALEWLIAAFMADGLTREGMSRFLNRTGDPASWNLLDFRKDSNFQRKLFSKGKALKIPDGSDFHEEEVELLVGGLAFKANSVTDYLAIALLLLHIVLCHSAFRIMTARSSDCWDSFTELAVLMHNSRPAPLSLRNASAGIRELKTFSKVGTIRAVKQDSREPDSISNVEIVFDEADQLDQPIEMTVLAEDNGPSSLLASGQSNSSRTLDSAEASNYHSRGQSTSVEDLRPMRRYERVKTDVAYGHQHLDAPAVENLRYEALSRRTTFMCFRVINTPNKQSLGFWDNRFRLGCSAALDIQEALRRLVVAWSMGLLGRFCMFPNQGASFDSPTPLGKLKMIPRSEPRFAPFRAPCSLGSAPVDAQLLPC
jgi:hypothetical protein